MKILLVCINRPALKAPASWHKIAVYDHMFDRIIKCNHYAFSLGRVKAERLRWTSTWDRPSVPNYQTAKPMSYAAVLATYPKKHPRNAIFSGMIAGSALNILPGDLSMYDHLINLTLWEDE